MASDEIAGLGLAIEVSNQGQCRVLHTIVGGSAHGCGKISPGDFLLAVLDRERSAEYLLTSGLDFNEVKSLIAGRRGTKVTLKMQHQDSFEENSGEIYLCEDLIRSPIQAPQLPVRATLDSFSPFSPLEMGLEGVGLVLDFKNSEYPTVSNLLPGKSAQASGKISIGDRLKSVDQISAKDKSFDEIRLMIAGPAGTFVVLSFEGAQGTYEEKLPRGGGKDRSPPLDSKLISLVGVPQSRNNLPELGASSSASLIKNSFPNSDLFGSKDVVNGTKELDFKAIEAAKREQEAADRRAADAKEEKARREASEAAKRAAQERIAPEDTDKEKRKREAEARPAADAKAGAPGAAAAAGGGKGSGWAQRLLVGVAAVALAAIVVSRTLR